MKHVVIGKERVSVAKQIGKGGEGEVYTIEGRSGLAVKSTMQICAQSERARYAQWSVKG